MVKSRERLWPNEIGYVMATFLLLQQVNRGKTFSKRRYSPEDPEGKKTGKIFAIIFSVLVLILLVAVFI